MLARPPRRLFTSLALVLTFLTTAPLFAQLPGLLPKADTQQSEPQTPTAEKSSEALFSQIRLDLLLEDNNAGNWLYLLIAIFIGVAVGRLVSLALRKAAKSQEEKEHYWLSGALNSAASPLSLAILTIGLFIGLSQLTTGPILRGFWPDVIELLVYISVFWFIFNAVELVEKAMQLYSQRRESEFGAMLIPLIRKTLRIFVVIWAALLIADNVFGQDIGAWLAGLGIVGLAVSLAAQDSLKNVFGSITILMDKPFKVGDRIQYKGFDGPVESIGFRSTRVRTLTGHQVTVPNSNIVNDPVENIGRRPYIRRIMNVTITYDTPPEKIREAVQIIRDIFEEPELAEPVHGKIGEDEFPPRVYFNDYNSASLNIIVIYWFFPPAYWDYLEHAQQLNLRLFEEYEKAGIEFAFPTQTVYLANDDRRQLAVQMLGDGTADPGG